MGMHQIRYFHVVADKLNFTRAAKSCGVTQPALTRAIKFLEAELGGSPAIRATVRVNAVLRPALSANQPIARPPKGRAMKPIAKAAKLSKSAGRSSPGAKNSLR